MLALRSLLYTIIILGTVNAGIGSVRRHSWWCGDCIATSKT